MEHDAWVKMTSSSSSGVEAEAEVEVETVVDVREPDWLVRAAELVGAGEEVLLERVEVEPRDGEVTEGLVTEVDVEALRVLDVELQQNGCQPSDSRIQKEFTHLADAQEP